MVSCRIVRKLVCILLVCNVHTFLLEPAQTTGRPQNGVQCISVDKFNEEKDLLFKDIKALKEEVQNLTQKTNILNMNQQARGQDFLALHDMTIDTRKTVAALKLSINELKQNDSDLQSQITENQFNDSLQQQQINDNSEQVALTAFHTPSGTVSGTIRFNHVTLSVGFTDLQVSEFKRSGQLTVAKNGLYVVSVGLLSGTRDAEFFLLTNGHAVARSDTHNAEGWSDATLTIILRLHGNDKVWVNTESGYLYGSNSCYISLIKIK